MGSGGNVTYNKISHNVINFYKARFEVVVGDGLDDGGFY